MKWYYKMREYHICHARISTESPEYICIVLISGTSCADSRMNITALNKSCMGGRTRYLYLIHISKFRTYLMLFFVVLQCSCSQTYTRIITESIIRSDERHWYRVLLFSIYFKQIIHVSASLLVCLFYFQSQFDSNHEKDGLLELRLKAGMADRSNDTEIGMICPYILLNRKHLVSSHPCADLKLEIKKKQR